MLTTAALLLLPATFAPPHTPAPATRAVQDEIVPWALEDIFGPDRMKGSLATGILWSPDGATFLYRDDFGDGTVLREHTVADGAERDVLDWDAFSEALKAARPDWSAPAMDDTNRTGRFDFPPLRSPDGDWLVGASNGDLWLLELATGDWKYLTEGAEPEIFFRFHPESGAVAFARENDLWMVDFASGEETRLTNRGDSRTLQNGVADWVYEEELGLQQSFWWSPDGTRIAYLQFETSPVSIFPIPDEMELVSDLEQQRYPKTGAANSRVRLGVLDVASGETTWVASGDEPEGYLVDAEWVDADRLWYLWLNRDQTQLELRLVEDGSTRTLVTETDERWVNVGPDPLFLDDTFLWTSERDGWSHLYHYSLEGKLLGRLTKGEWEVGSIDGVVDDGQAVLYSSSEGGAIEHHVWRVALDGSGKQRVDTESGWHSANVSPTGDAWIDTWSATDVPTRIEVATSSGEHLRTLDDGAIPGLEKRRFGPSRLQEIDLDDKTTVWTRTIFPPDFDETRKHPVVIYVYGGPIAQVVRNRWDGSRALYHQFLVQEGALVFSLDNRGAGGRGRDFARLLYRRLGSIEVEDQARGVDWLRQQPWVDGERIGIYGGSYGGFMTLNCLMRAPEHFAAGVSYAPVTDFRFYDTIYTERFMDTPQDNPDGYTAGAPLEYADGLQGKLLLVHGTMDNNVHFQNSVQMIDELARAGKEFELMLYPRTRHALRDHDYRLHFNRLSFGFLAEALGLGRDSEER